MNDHQDVAVARAVRAASGQRARIAAGVALLASALSGCNAGDARTETLSATGEELYWDSSQTWSHRDVSVCWTFSGFASEKALVKAALAGARSWSSAGNVNFVGFHGCGSGDADIEISNGDNATGFGVPREMSLDFGPAPETRWARCSENGLDRNACIQATALHEFGHALGYLHEQNRDDVNVPASCDDKADDGFDGDSTFGAFDVSSITAYCNFSTELSTLDRRGTDRVYGPRFGDAPRLGDYDGDGRKDLFCRDAVGGSEFVDYASSSGQFAGTDFSAALAWCNDTDDRRLFKGDFNGDGRTDLLCFDMVGGSEFIDYADASGHFGGTDWSAALDWCNGADSRRLYVGDFNGDGRDDLLCHDRASGSEWIDYASSTGKFGGTDWSAALGWCNDTGARRLHVGDFDGDGRDDLLCHDLVSGSEWIDYASSTGKFDGTDWSAALGWCNFDGAAVFVGDFNGDRRSDLLCHSATSGDRWIDYANSSGHFGGTDWSAGNDWCRSNGTRLFVGDVNGDRRDDLVCHKLAAGSADSGTKFVDYADASGHLGGTDWHLAGWCDDTSSRELL